MSIESPPISALDLEHQYGAQNYHPLPVVLHRGSGCRVWDTDGKEYLDFCQPTPQSIKAMGIHA